jgi:hypothetical protein
LAVLEKRRRTFLLTLPTTVILKIIKIIVILKMKNGKKEGEKIC